MEQAQTSPVEYRIGDWVRCDQVAALHLDHPSEHYRTVVGRALTQPLVGQVVGAAYVYEGWYSPYQPPQYRGDLGDSEPEPAVFTPEARVLVWEVRLGMTNRPVRVLPEHMTKLAPRGRTLPKMAAWRRQLADDERNLKPL